jgi:hypothetical protein
MTQDDWAAQFMKYKGTEYGLGGYGDVSTSSNYEAIGNDFEGYVQQAVKADGVVFACLVARQFLFSEARFQWQKIRKGRPGDLFGTKDLEIFEKPWPGGSTVNLLNRAIQHADIGGNHYCVREGKRLRVLRPDWVDIILTAPPDQAVESDVAGYLYKPGGTQDRTKWKIYLAGDYQFAHWAPIPDPEAQYRGMSWMTPVIREIMADKAATKHKGKFFENGATPSFAISFKETVTAEQFKEFMTLMKQSHQSADNAYKPLYLGGGADVTPMMYDMRQLDFKATQGAGETRIAAAAQIHPVIVGLSEGMQGSSLNAGNFKAAKDAFGDRTLRPLWHSLCSSYASLIKEPSDARLWYDDRDISFLREDLVQKAQVMKEEAQAITRLVQDGFTWDSARQAILEGGDWSLLDHTGLFSVQLQPPYPNGLPTAQPGGAAGATKAPAAGGPKPTPLQNKVAKAAKNGASPSPTTKTPGKPGSGAKRDGIPPEEEDSTREAGSEAEAGREALPAEAGREAEARREEAPGEEGRAEEAVPAEEEVDDGPAREEGDT